MKKPIKALLALALSISLSAVTFAKDDLLYHYDFDHKQMYSLEGEISRLYYPEINLKYPGTYYVSSYDGNDLVSVRKIEVSNKFSGNNFTVRTDDDFVQCVRYAIENMLPSITIVKQGNTSSPQKYLARFLNRTLDKYPELSAKSFSASHQYKNGTVIFKINFEYYFDNVSDLNNYNARLNKIIDNVITGAIKSGDPEKYVYDYIKRNVDYSSTYSYKNTVQGALVDGIANCEGYSKSLMYLLNVCGVQSDVVSGRTPDGVGHMWNRVYYKSYTDNSLSTDIGVEDDSTYVMYYCDITFEDTNGKDYYNLSYSPHQEIDFYPY